GDAGGGTVLEGCSSRGGGSFTAHVLTNAQTTVHDTERGAVVHRARGLDKGSGRLGFADAERELLGGDERRGDVALRRGRPAATATAAAAGVPGAPGTPGLPAQVQGGGNNDQYDCEQLPVHAGSLRLSPHVAAGGLVGLTSSSARPRCRPGTPPTPRDRPAR